MQSAAMRHPREMGVADVETFLYREVLGFDLPWLNNFGRPQQTKRIPSVLTKDEVAGLLEQLDGVTALLTRLLYGTGMRLMEGMRLRIKDVDFERHVIIVREAKGAKEIAMSDEAIFVGRAIEPADPENTSGYRAHIPLSAVFSKPAALQSSMY
jgi:integrase